MWVRRSLPLGTLPLVEEKQVSDGSRQRGVSQVTRVPHTPCPPERAWKEDSEVDEQIWVRQEGVGTSAQEDPWHKARESFLILCQDVKLFLSIFHEAKVLLLC